MMRYDFSAEKVGLKVTPFALAKYIPGGAPIYYDGGIVIDFRDFIWVNATYKSGYGVTAGLGFRIKKSIVVGYGYDLVLNNAKSYSGINQEILVGYRFPVKGTDNEKNKKELEEAQKEIERLNNELLTKKAESDSINAREARIKKQAEEEFAAKEQRLNDSINALNQALAKKEEIISQQKNNTNTNAVNNTNTVDNSNTTNNTNNNNTVTNSRNKNPNSPVKFDESQIKKSKDDYFLEMDESDSPQGFYVVVGAYSRDDYAKSHLDRTIGNFPSARLIYNKRNGFKYIVLIYSTEKAPVFETQAKARQSGISKVWILNYTR